MHVARAAVLRAHFRGGSIPLRLSARLCPWGLAIGSSILWIDRG